MTTRERQKHRRRFVSGPRHGGRRIKARWRWINGVFRDYYTDDFFAAILPSRPASVVLVNEAPLVRVAGWGERMGWTAAALPALGGEVVRISRDAIAALYLRETPDAP